MVAGMSQNSPSVAPPLLLSLLLILSSFPTTKSQPTTTTRAAGAVEDAEKRVLVQIKEDFGNPAVLRRSWTDSIHHCNWTGIECSAGGSITAISLRNLNITDPIPSAICDLNNIAKIDLYYNLLPGPFPTHLYNCSNLQYLDISQNLFVGTLPSDIHRMSPRLAFLSLSANNFTGDIPPSIGQLPAIRSLLLDNNLFYSTHLAKEFGNLSTLEVLYLANNPFAQPKIPPELGNLTELNYLFAASASLVGEIPETLGKLTQLVHLDLAMNLLSGPIPQGIWMLEKLQLLYLYHNNLSGEMINGGDRNIGARSLVGIDAAMNQLTGSIPEGFGELHHLTTLFLWYNQLSGQIPAAIGLLPSLHDLRLFNNSLTGILPPELGKHSSSLWNVEVSENSISGELPEYICGRGALTSLVVSNNNLSGLLPASLGNCQRLVNLQIYNNRFSGNVPSGIWSAANLSTVIMRNNALSGALPDKLPWNLTRLELDSNLFTGRIPSWAGRLKVFKASDNLFSGEIPVTLSGVSDLQVLSLPGNQISGVIPEQISSLRFLTELNLSNNLLSGEIPPMMGYLPSLTILDISDNHLSGSIPPEMGKLRLNFLNLSSNQLSGEIPISLRNPANDRSFLSNPGLCLFICPPQPDGSSKFSIRLVVISLIAAAVFLVMFVPTFIFILRKKFPKTKYAFNRSHSTAWKVISFHSLDFTASDILSGLNATNMIGSGGSGMVYRIGIGNPLEKWVAVKKICNTKKLDSRLEKEFQAEVEILGSIRHANIVNLLGCISSASSKHLVYEYLENGSLYQWLHSGGGGAEEPSVVGGGGLGHSSVLDWPARLRIAIGSARGLCYMHHDCSPPIVHRDVKSSNILLESDFHAKIADFGLARILVKAGEPESVSAIAGTFGYMAPECARLRKVNEKVDVYSFGVVLLELTTGRRANRGDEYQGLADWAWRQFEEGSVIMDMIDESIRESSSSPCYREEMEAVFKLGLICTGALPMSRPSMKEVVQVLLRISRAAV